MEKKQIIIGAGISLLAVLFLIIFSRSKNSIESLDNEISELKKEIADLSSNIDNDDIENKKAMKKTISELKKELAQKETEIELWKKNEEKKETNNEPPN